MKILFYILWGTICAFIAAKKGRNVFAWGSLGFFFGIFAIITVALLSDKSVEKSEEENEMIEIL